MLERGLSLHQHRPRAGQTFFFGRKEKPWCSQQADREGATETREYQFSLRCSRSCIGLLGYRSQSSFHRLVILVRAYQSHHRVEVVLEFVAAFILYL